MNEGKPAESAAFVLSTGQVAASYRATRPGITPMVQVMNLGMGISVCGVEALAELRKAIDFALDSENSQPMG